MPSGGGSGARPKTSTPRYRTMPVDPPNTRSGRYANNQNRQNTGWVRLIRSHSSARFCFELSGNLNYKIICNSNLAKNFELEISLN